MQSVTNLRPGRANVAESMLGMRSVTNAGARCGFVTDCRF
jgi:hypothetical protein